MARGDESFARRFLRLVRFQSPLRADGQLIGWPDRSVRRQNAQEVHRPWFAHRGQGPGTKGDGRLLMTPVNLFVGESIRINAYCKYSCSDTTPPCLRRRGVIPPKQSLLDYVSHGVLLPPTHTQGPVRSDIAKGVVPGGSGWAEFGWIALRGREVVFGELELVMHSTRFPRSSAPKSHTGQRGAQIRPLANPHPSRPVRAERSHSDYAALLAIEDP